MSTFKVQFTLYKLFNLSNTYDKIQAESDMIWKNQRFQLIYEYIESPILPPPLNILIYLWNLSIHFFKNLKKFVSKLDNNNVMKDDANTENNFFSILRN